MCFQSHLYVSFVKIGWLYVVSRVFEESINDIAVEIAKLRQCTTRSTFTADKLLECFFPKLEFYHLYFVKVHL